MFSLFELHLRMLLAALISILHSLITMIMMQNFHKCFHHILRLNETNISARELWREKAAQIHGEKFWSGNNFASKEKEEQRNHVARRPDQGTQPKYIFDADITVLFYSDSCSAISPNYVSEHSRCELRGAGLSATFWQRENSFCVEFYWNFWKLLAEQAWL